MMRSLKFFHAKRIVRLYYEMKYNNEKKFYKEYFTKKMACLCFIGIPYKVVSEIYVPTYDKDIEL